jgi:hypothetical protein
MSRTVSPTSSLSTYEDSSVVAASAKFTLGLRSSGADRGVAQDADGDTPRYRFRLRIIGFFRDVAGERPDAASAQPRPERCHPAQRGRRRPVLRIAWSRSPRGKGEETTAPS